MIIMFFLFEFAFCQDNAIVSNDTLSTIEVVDKLPEFPGGIYNFYRLIAKDLPVPKIEGSHNRLCVNFVIDIDGRIIDIRILGDIREGSEKRLMKTMKKCPKWIPAERNGIKVKHELQIPVIAAN
ncbi:hypothetical protein DOS84_08395 [Flavobacterium aquariorum]|uniref:TonB C-terminal domain-containing protein n=2 Tax=Flavobacterium aquariorum TaxID=2217670 RepID=A0A2W7VPA4_9FLAO|nr:hypothetical protein DOS84_08395 [Flavobacterium aquariorum]